jgi:hypothetical protein
MKVRGDRMERKQITLSRMCLKKLKIMGKKTGLSASELIRNSVDVYFKEIMPEEAKKVSHPRA